MAPFHRVGPLEGDTVLLIEDDEQVLGMAVESLEELHYRVIVARYAAEALVHLYGVERIDILFSNVMMPGSMSGSRLAIEAQRLRPGLNMLLTSRYVANLDEGQVIGRGNLPVLNSPTDVTNSPNRFASCSEGSGPRRMRWTIVRSQQVLIGSGEATSGLLPSFR